MYMLSWQPSFYCYLSSDLMQHLQNCASQITVQFNSSYY
jgi:hypothetical protein